MADIRSQQEVNAIINHLCSDLKPLFPQGSMEAILFGSYANGEADADSDIDVMVLVDSSRQDISEKMWEMIVPAFVVLDVHVFSPSWFVGLFQSPLESKHKATFKRVI